MTRRTRNNHSVSYQVEEKYEKENIHYVEGTFNRCFDRPFDNTY